MNNKLEVIGIDHGWSMMKTVTQVFVTGVKEITTTPALFGDVLEYDGKYYKIGTVRQEVKDTKVEDDSFYLLTLAAVAKELKKRGLSDAKVFLAVGLPLTRFGAERNNFIKYLTKNKRVDFRYENEAYKREYGTPEKIKDVYDYRAKLKQKFYFYQDLSKDDDIPKNMQNDFLHQMYKEFGTIEEEYFYDRLEDGKYDEGFKERQVKEKKSR